MFQRKSTDSVNNFLPERHAIAALRPRGETVLTHAAPPVDTSGGSWCGPNHRSGLVDSRKFTGQKQKRVCQTHELRCQAVEVFRAGRSEGLAAYVD